MTQLTTDLLLVLRKLMLIIKIFLQDLWVHIPAIRKRKSDTIPRSLTSPSSNIDIHSTQTASASTSIVPHSVNIDKHPHLYAIFSRMTNISSYPKKPMPIINNNSPPLSTYIFKTVYAWLSILDLHKHWEFSIPSVGNVSVFWEGGRVSAMR